MMTSASAQDTTVAPGQSVKLLLVDDHPENLLALEAILEAPGQELVLARSGAEALLELQNERLDEEGKRYLHRVRAGTQRMCRLVDDLLMLSKVSRQEMRRERVDLSAMARSIAADLRQREPEREVECVVQPDLVT